MRLQHIREGQIYKTRTGDNLLVVNVFKDDHNFHVQFELGGILSSMDITDFRQQVHHLVQEPVILDEMQSKESLIKEGFTYEDGDIWLSESGEKYIVVRNLRSSASSVALVRTLESLASFEVTNTKAVNLNYRLSTTQPAKIEQVMYKGYVCDVIHSNSHSLDIVQYTEEVEEDETGAITDVDYTPFALTVGFGNVLSYNPIYQYVLEDDTSELSDLIWFAGTLNDPNVQKKLAEIEYDITKYRWEFL